MENLYKTAHGVNGELDKFFLVKEILDRVNGSILPSDSRLIPGLSVTFSLAPEGRVGEKPGNEVVYH